MRTITKTIYNFDELSEESQQNTCEYVRENWVNFYPSHNDNIKSLKEFAKLLGGKASWEVQLSGYGHSGARITDLPDYLTEDNKEYRSEDSYQPLDWIHDNQEIIETCCPFTGYHMDEYLLDPMREYLKDPADHTMEQLINKGVMLWVKAYVADWDSCYTDEYIADFFVANEFEFDEDGSIYK